MALRTVFLVLTGAAVLVNGLSLGMMMAALDRRGQKTNIFLVRLLFFRYLAAYKEATRKETGKTGPFYGVWFGSLALIFIFALAAILVTRI
jgi:hypothetical protein